MAESHHARQTMLLVATEGGPPAQLAVDCNPSTIVDVIGRCEKAAGKGGAVGFLQFRQPLGADGSVYVRHDAVIAFWDQQVEIVNDPRAFGVQQTPGGIHLPPKPN